MAGDSKLAKCLARELALQLVKRCLQIMDKQQGYEPMDNLII